MTHQPHKNRFIAFQFLPERHDWIKAHLSSYQSQLNNLATFKWTLPADYHITVGYMRKVADADLPSIKNSLQAIVPQLPPFSANVIYPQFLGHALTLILGPDERFQDYYQSIDEAVQITTSGQYPFATHGKFLPHLTLGKISPHFHLTEEIKADALNIINNAFQSVNFDIASLGLLQTKSNPDKTGRYEALAKWELL